MKRIPTECWAGIVTVLALVPFVTKAFHVDDPLFIWMAQQITHHALDPYGFNVNWSTYLRPMWDEMQNPPLCSYFIALAGSLAGWREEALHGAFLLWAVAVIIGTYRLGRRLCESPGAAALLTLFTPVFLVSATNVMCDVMLLGLFVWAVECWIAGVDYESRLLLLLSAVLSSAAVLTKYFGIAIVPLLVAYTIARNRRQLWPLAFLLLPVAVTIGYDVATKMMYGRGLFIGATAVARGAWSKFHLSLVAQMLVGFAFTGGCLATFTFFIRSWKSWVCFGGMILLGFTCFRFLVPINPDWALGENTVLVRLEGGLFIGIALGVLVLATLDLNRSRDPDSLLLFLWTIGTFSFATFFNWSVTARTVLPLVPPAAILTMRFSPVREIVSGIVRLCLAAVFSLTVATADFRQANSAREAAAIFRREFQAETSTVWFQSHWGFQFYMQQWGAKPVNGLAVQFRPSDVVIIPANNTAIISINLEKVFPPETIEIPVLPLITTFGRGTGACFYSSMRGPIPWALDRVDSELYYVARFR